jgi:hypothetical protein
MKRLIKLRVAMIVALGLAGATAAVPAAAQEAAPANSTIGPPQLRDFSLTPRQRLVAQPPPETRQAPVTTPPATRTSPPPVRPPAASATRDRQPAASEPLRTPPAEAAPIAAPEPQPVAEAPLVETPISEPAEIAAPEPEAPAPPTSALPFTLDLVIPTWSWAPVAAALGLLLAFWWRTRRRRAPAGTAAPLERELFAVPETPRVVPSEPVRPAPRPWLELELRAERAVFNETEAQVEFELEISNKGEVTARNLRIDVKMFNAGAQQDKEIGAFFRSAGREQTKLTIPAADAGIVGVIRGTVKLSLDEMRAVRLDERLLFIPVIAVNALYDWGEGLTGQTSKSYLIGREHAEGAEKMGAFRVDQGPRIWRTVGQRPHKLARRV